MPARKIYLADKDWSEIVPHAVKLPRKLKMSERQEIEEWLVGEESGCHGVYGTTYDAFRTTYRFGELTTATLFKLRWFSRF